MQKNGEYAVFFLHFDNVERKSRTFCRSEWAQQVDQNLLFTLRNIILVAE